MEFLLYPFIIALPFLLRDSLIDRLLSSINQVLRVLESDYTRGQRFYKEIMFLSREQGVEKLVNYKFYRKLVQTIIENSNEYGSPMRAPMEVLKKSLLADLSKQKKLQELRNSAYGNFLMAALITWLFGHYSTLTLGQNINSWVYLMIGGWQVFGILSFAEVLKRLEVKKLADFELIFSKVYSLRLLSLAGVCVNDLVRKSGIENLYDLKVPGLIHHLERLEHIIEQRIKKGEEIDDELVLFIDELWELYDIRSVSYKKIVTFLKFIWLCLFFFSSYLFIVFSILNSFNI